MDVFISWSGPRSGAVAKALKQWLPQVVNSINPWLSAEDIDKGARWGSKLADTLRTCQAGIICITPGNVHSDWLLFEAGALSKTVDNTYVCPLLIDLQPVDVKPPLSDFQVTEATEPDVLKLVQTLNRALGVSSRPDQDLKEAFHVWWPKLEDKLGSLPYEDSASITNRHANDMLREILTSVRDLTEAARLSREARPGLLCARTGPWRGYENDYPHVLALDPNIRKITFTVSAEETARFQAFYDNATDAQYDISIPSGSTEHELWATIKKPIRRAANNRVQKEGVRSSQEMWRRIQEELERTKEEKEQQSATSDP